MAIVDDYMDGNCRIIIHDDYVAKTPKEQEKILKNLAETYVKYRLREAAEEVEKNKVLG